MFSHLNENDLGRSSSIGKTNTKTKTHPPAKAEHSRSLKKASKAAIVKDNWDDSGNGNINTNNSNNNSSNKDKQKTERLMIILYNIVVYCMVTITLFYQDA